LFSSFIWLSNFISCLAKTFAWSSLSKV
jgi:hypothetical protein